MEEKITPWIKPKWDRHKDAFGNSYFYALEAVCCKIVGYNPWVEERNKMYLAIVKDIFNAIMSQGEEYTCNFLMMYKLIHSHKTLTIDELFK